MVFRELQVRMALPGILEMALLISMASLLVANGMLQSVHRANPVSPAVAAAAVAPAAVLKTAGQVPWPDRPAEVAVPADAPVLAVRQVVEGAARFASFYIMMCL